MRIVFVTPGFAEDENDTTCIPPLQMLVKNMLRRGVKIDIIALEYPFHSKPYSWHAARVFPCGGANRRWLKWRTYFRSIYRFVALTDEGKVDYIHAFWLDFPMNLARSMSNGEKIPWYATAMGQDVFTAGKKIEKLGETIAQHLVAVSEYQNAELEAETGFRAKHVIPWGYLEEEIPASLPKTRSVDLLAVGSFLEVKNYWLMLDVLVLVVKEMPDLQAEIIGDGPLFEAVERKALALGLEKNLKLHGHIERPEVLEIMRESKVFLHTAHFESFGMVLVEALANGCRVVSTPVGIAPEIPEIDTADKAEDLAKLVLENLKKPIQTQPIVPLKFNDTGWKYWELYHL